MADGNPQKSEPGEEAVEQCDAAYQMPDRDALFTERHLDPMLLDVP